MAKVSFRTTGPLLLALTLALGACGPATPQRPPTPERPLVIASFYPLYEFARQVGGDRVEVRTLVPAGAEPHGWEPSPQDLADLSQAQVFIYNGAGLEPWAERVLREVGKTIPVVVNATEGMELLSVSADEGEDTSARQEHVDPHVWLDPVRARQQVQAIARALTEVDPEYADTYETNARVYLQRLDELHQQLLGGLQDCRSRALATTHASFSYLAARYGLTPLAISGLSPEAAPSPGKLAEVAKQAQALGVTTIYFETLVSPAVAETLAREIGAQTLALNPIERLTSEQEAAGESYLTLMEENLANLRLGLGCT